MGWKSQTAQCWRQHQEGPDEGLLPTGGKLREHPQELVEDNVHTLATECSPTHRDSQTKGLLVEPGKGDLKRSRIKEGQKENEEPKKMNRIESSWHPPPA